MIRVLIVVCVVFSCQSAAVMQALPDDPIAFPGAEGFGRYATGGRGGKVYIVTNLNDSGPGSLREAVTKKDPRIIVFGVSGTIELQSTLDINHGNLTIAGQSAPGDGICLRNYAVKVKGENIIIRYLRFRLGDEQREQDDALSGVGQSNVIIDHCSISWGTDECASFYRNKNFTMQWCIISEGLNSSVHEKGDHGYGGIWGGMNASFHHNLLASHNSRLPRFSGSATTPNSADELVDFSNNVIFNWGSNSTYGGEKGKYNMVNNYYKPGSATKSNKPWMVNPSQPYGKFFITGNYFDGNELITKDNWLGVKADYVDSLIVTKAYPISNITLQHATDAYHAVLQHAGASHKRDAIDQRIIEEVRSGKSTMGSAKNGIIDSQKDVGGWPELKSAIPAKDSDLDGMPDAWEIKNKLNPNDPKDAALFSLHKQYTNVEVYLNEILTK